MLVSCEPMPGKQKNPELAQLKSRIFQVLTGMPSGSPIGKLCAELDRCGVNMPSTCFWVRRGSWTRAHRLHGDLVTSWLSHAMSREKRASRALTESRY